MTMKIGGGNYGEFGSSNLFDQLVKSAANNNGNGATLISSEPLSLGEPNDKLPEIPTTVNVTVRAGETPYQREYRALMQAAKDAGLPLDEQKQFAKDYTDGKFSWSKGDPTPKDGRLVTTADLQLLVGRSIPYTLSSDQISGLEKRRNDFLARNENLISNQKVAASGSDTVNDSAPVDEVKPNTPKTVRDFVVLPKNGGATADRALFWHIKDKFGKGNLEIDNFQNIFDRAKANGISIKITDVKPQGDNYLVRFEMNSQDVAKLKQLYVEGQAVVNKQIETFNNAVRDTVAQSFAEGFFTGAYGSLKSNADMLYTATTDPLGTAWKVGEALVSIPTLGTKIGVELGKAAVELAKLTPDQRQALVDELINAGHTELKGLTGPALAKKTGEIVGALAMEAVLGKGVGLALKGLSALKGTAFLGKVEALGAAAKQTIANTKVPVRASVEAVVDTAGGVTPVVNIEKKPLGEVLNTMMAKAKEAAASSSEKLEMLEDGSTVGRQAIKETAEEGLMEKAQSGLKHLRYEIPKEVMARAKEQLVTLNVARTELIARLDDLIQNSNLLPDTKDVLDGTKNSLKNHLKQDDLVGALRDKFGKDVRRSGDGYTYDHLGEVKRGLASLNKADEFLLSELKHKPKGSSEFIQLSKELDAIKEMKRRVELFLEIK